MRVLITGAAGLIGSEVATHLQAKGFEVHLIDSAPSTDSSSVPYVVCDIMDFDSLSAQMQGCDAVVHMAALRSPRNGPSQDVFRINTAGTFNVFEAAAKAGIRRVVQASSINALGCAWNITDFSPQYLPVDEDHPLTTNDPYSFSKQMIEEIGAYYWRREGISSIALRLPGIYRAELLNTSQHLEHRKKMSQFLDDLAQSPLDEQNRFLAQAREVCLKFRAARRLEYPSESATPAPEGISPLLWQAYTFDRFNLWASLDVRDAAAAIEKSLTADFEGSHSLFVSDTRNSLGYDSHALARMFFPEVTQWKQAVSGSESLVNVNRARELIGFEPSYTLSEVYRP
ncbi:MAG: NAD(P)-dependent oxidoreductase [Chloroflexota bacterium]